MTQNEFLALCEKEPLYLDGATGSYLMEKGMPKGVCPEQWILEHQALFIQLQKEYIAAGTRILYAPTFTCNSVKLQEYGLESKLSVMNQELVKLSKKAAFDSETNSCKAYVAGDITMTGEPLFPMGKMDFETLISIYKEQVCCLLTAGVDLFVIETMMSLQETRAAVIAVKELCDLPIMATLTFEADGRTLYGTDAKTAAVALSALGVSAVGANCSTGPDKLLPIIRQMAEVTDIPIIAKPNAGLPVPGENGSTVYDMDADTFAEEMTAFIKAGACILGGCCGTTPDYIRKLKKATENIPVEKRTSPAKCMLSSERRLLSFGLEDPFLVVGERINPTGKKQLQAELREGSFELVKTYAEQQELCGAGVLDVNMGMNGIDEKKSMLRAISEIAQVSALPLSLDSSHVEVLEAALRHYPGRALINSISLESHKIEKLLPLARKYGAMFILLPLSDKGLPENTEEKIQIIDTIVRKALALGMSKKDIVVDGLVATVGANKRAALETLETIAYCKRNGLATICGLSNISFGLPERICVNANFLTMAIQAGLTMAIANPSQQQLMSGIYAADLLLNKEGADIRYITYMNLQKEQSVSSEEHPDKKTDKTTGELVYEAVLKGNRSGILSLTKTAISSGITPDTLLNGFLLPAINEVGDLFDKGTYFLPQLIASAEAMKNSIEYLEPLLQNDSQKKEMPVIVIATVEGDIHDIGKNLVTLMLKNHGFRVVDLGKDVSCERILDAAMEHHAAVIALSALMTTTMQEMKHVIACAKERKVPAKIIIGGAVITQSYADEIEADGYSKDAADAVKLVKKLLNMQE